MDPADPDRRRRLSREGRMLQGRRPARAEGVAGRKSPFDQFRNYEDRGDRFESLVRERPAAAPVR